MSGRYPLWMNRILGKGNGFDYPTPGFSWGIYTLLVRRPLRILLCCRYIYTDHSSYTLFKAFSTCYPTRPADVRYFYFEALCTGRGRGARAAVPVEAALSLSSYYHTHASIRIVRVLLRLLYDLGWLYRTRYVRICHVRLASICVRVQLSRK